MVRSGACDLVFDARHVNASGIGTYVKRILDVLPDWSHASGRQVMLLGDQDELLAHDPGLAALRTLDCPRGSAPMYGAREQIALHQAIKSSGCAAFWTPHYPTPLAADCRVFVTIHDILHTLSTHVGGPSLPKRAYARGMVRRALKRSSGVFAVSRHTGEALQRFGTAARILHAPFSIDPAWFEPLRAESPVEGPYLVYVGNVKPHKNLNRLIAAFGLIHKRIPHRLVVAGGSAVTSGLWRQQVEIPHHMEHRVLPVGLLSFEKLRALVAGADALVMPSLYEGVGLPPLEAMAVGTAVVSGRGGSLPETCGGAAHYCDPYSVDDIAKAMLEVATSASLRDTLRSRGSARVAARNAAVDDSYPLTVIEASLN